MRILLDTSVLVEGERHRFDLGQWVEAAGHEVFICDATIVNSSRFADYFILPVRLPRWDSTIGWRPGKGRSRPGIAGGNHEVREMDGRRMTLGQLDPHFHAPWAEKV